MITPISRIETTQPAVAITFDDGPHEINTLKFVELFEKEGVKVTFFELGKRILEFPDLAVAVHVAGHEIGNHSINHPHLSSLSIEEIREQLSATQRIIEEATGFMPKVFRAPYLDQDEKVWTVCEELGLPSINASVSAQDWREEATTEQIVRDSTEKVAPGDIIVLHTWQTKSLVGMPEMIRILKGKGLACVTVSELMAMRTEN